MKSKFFFNIFFVIFFWVLGTGILFAQNPQDNQALFGQLQKELAGDPDTWRARSVDKRNNNTFVPVSFTPQQVLDLEESKRTTIDPDDSDTFDIAPADEETRSNMDVSREIFDADSWTGAFFRTMIAISSSEQENYFTGEYIVPTTEKTELGKIKSIYNYITKTVTRYGAPAGGESASYCLTEGVGECRHMATVLQESLEKAGVTSSLVLSPNHVWVRVTLTDPEYAGITFDLDPTWYQQPIPLPPRERTPMSADWKKKILAIVTPVSGILNLNGKWVLNSATYNALHVGNSLVLQTAEETEGRAAGKTRLMGTIADLKFDGQRLLIADQCPNLDHYVSATGEVSSDGYTITVDFLNEKFDPENCVDIPGSQHVDSDTYTKVGLDTTPTPEGR